MCKCLNVTRSGYYNFCIAQPSRLAKQDEVLSDKITTIFNQSRQTYGTRRIRRALFNQGISVSRRRIGRIMTLERLSCKSKKKFRVTTDSKHKLPISANLLNREFNVSKPDQCYVGDITYIHTLSGWLYLAVVIDLFSRQVVGWSMSDNMQAKLVNDALLMAIWKRKPCRGLLWHTDRGSQYASDSHRQILQIHGIKQSMSRSI